jgi:hypothetical protein
LRFDARKAAFRKHSETGSSLRPFTPLQGLPVSGSPRQAHCSWPIASLTAANPAFKPVRSSGSQPCFVSVAGLLTAGNPLLALRSAALHLSCRRRSPSGLSSLGISLPCGRRRARLPDWRSAGLTGRGFFVGKRTSSDGRLCLPQTSPPAYRRFRVTGDVEPPGAACSPTR